MQSINWGFVITLTVLAKSKQDLNKVYHTAVADYNTNALQVFTCVVHKTEVLACLENVFRNDFAILLMM